MTLEPPNYTIFIQFLLFLGTVFVLNWFVFTPFLKIIEERRKKTIETFNNAQLISHKTQGISVEYEEQIKEHKDHLRQKLDETRRTISTAQSEKLHQTKEELTKNLQEEHQKIKVHISKVEKELSQDIKGLASEIAQKFLGAT